MAGVHRERAATDVTVDIDSSTELSGEPIGDGAA